MKFTRLFTTPTPTVADQIKWKTLPSEILDKDGNRLFYMPEVQVPDHWSQGATNILAQKYFRKAGVPNLTIMAGGKDFESTLPTWLVPSIPDDTNLDFKLSSESSAKQVFHRLAGAWTYWGWKEGIFNLHLQKNMKPYTSGETCESNAQIFYDEIYYMLAMQFAAPNSPQWFNTGLNWAYGITGNPSGQWAVDEKGQPYETSDSYTHPQPHACFIQPVTDSLVSSGGIMDLWTKEARLFKQGSGTGTNFSSIRGKGESLSGGGKSSGLMSFLKIGDVVAGSIASGGTTRRAAKMVCLDLDHPEIEDFIDWKMKEEAKAAALFVGSQIIFNQANEPTAIEYNNIPQAMKDRVLEGIEFEICDLGFEGKAMSTVDGQNANDSIRITDEFLKKVDLHGNWPLIARTTGKIVKVLKSEELWQKICRAAWACADPGLQFHDTINLWHTCKADGNINASNPCSEYMFLDDTACNLASLNLGKFLVNGEFNTKSFIHATRIWATVLEISVYKASFPSKEIARNSYLYRTLGLGYANIGGILMRLGLGYDSDEGRNWAANITALMHGVAYKTSSEIAQELGPFERYHANKEPMHQVIARHMLAAAGLSNTNNPLYKDVEKVWKNLITSEAPSFRNAQVTLLAPTGTIALLMDCDTTGIEPDFSLVKYKHLSGGGMMKIVNECVPEALKTLGYTPAQIMSITQHITNHDTIEGWTVNGQSMSEEHLKVFDCAVPGGSGTRSLLPIAHVKMVAAVQPFLSGAVSKTVNMPNSATISDVDHIYHEAHRLGLKAIAIYRDGSKLTQPLNTKQVKIAIYPSFKAELLADKINLFSSTPTTPSPERSEGRVPDMGPAILKNNITENFLVEETPTTLHSDSKHNYNFTSDEVREIITEEVKTLHKSFEDLLNKTPDPRLTEIDTILNLQKEINQSIIPRGKRLRLPPRTTGYRQKFIVDGQSIYLRTGEYEDGSLGEIFIDFSREGSLVRALINSIGKLTSIGLQYGVPLSALVNAFVYTKFEPSGIVIGHDRIKLCTSPIDLIFRDLAIHYLGMEEFANIDPPSPERSEGRVPDPEPKKYDPINIGKEFDELNIEFIKATINVEGLGSSVGNTITTSDIETIGLCSHGRMMLVCPICAPGENLVELSSREPMSSLFDPKTHARRPAPDSTIIQDSRISSGLEHQEPLGKEFEQVLYENLNDLYIQEPKPTIRLKHGDACQLCGHYPTLRTGTCITCPNCHANSGCG